jgi:hypothetical protein
MTTDHRHAPYLGLRHIPPDLNEFELNTFFTFSSKECALIDDRRRDLCRLALALHLGFVRMTGCTLDAYKKIPKALWTYLRRVLKSKTRPAFALASHYLLILRNCVKPACVSHPAHMRLECPEADTAIIAQ